MYHIVTDVLCIVRCIIHRSVQRLLPGRRLLRLHLLWWAWLTLISGNAGWHCYRHDGECDNWYIDVVNWLKLLSIKVMGAAFFGVRSTNHSPADASHGSTHLFIKHPHPAKLHTQFLLTQWARQKAFFGLFTTNYLALTLPAVWSSLGLKIWRQTQEGVRRKDYMLPISWSSCLTYLTG